MRRDRAAWAVRHPLTAAGRLVRRLDRDRRLPVGRTARTRRLLREVLHGHPCALVIGPPHAVRQALPGVALDVVGTRAGDPNVTVVSEALGPGSLPRRWDCVVVTEVDPPQDRLVAAAGACLPGGVVVVVGSGAQEPVGAPGAVAQRRVRSGDVSVAVGRLPG
jgi:hypothetical protein